MYEASVQNAEADVEFFSRAYRETRQKEALNIREDFCGTFIFCCEWVKSHPKRVATGVDLASLPLDFGRKYHLSKLSHEQKSRLHILQQNVMEASKTRYDLVAASNFSYFIFKQRAVLLKYIKSVYTSLEKDGVFILDHFGGPGAAELGKERRKIELGKHKYQYIWDCESVNLFTGEALFHIHFKDLQKNLLYEKVFSYDWRMWTIPELRDLLLEAGFSKVLTYKDMDEDFRKQDCNESDDDSWLVQIVAAK